MSKILENSFINLDQEVYIPAKILVTLTIWKLKLSPCKKIIEIKMQKKNLMFNFTEKIN
jgi:hypothetical protein